MSVVESVDRRLKAALGQQVAVVGRQLPSIFLSDRDWASRD
jgi:hypothetical protein